MDVNAHFKALRQALDSFTRKTQTFPAKMVKIH